MNTDEQEKRQKAKGWNDPPFFTFDQMNKASLVSPNSNNHIHKRYKYPQQPICINNPSPVQSMNQFFGKPSGQPFSHPFIQPLGQTISQPIDQLLCQPPNQPLDQQQYDNHSFSPPYSQSYQNNQLFSSQLQSYPNNDFQHLNYPQYQNSFKYQPQVQFSKRY